MGYAISNLALGVGQSFLCRRERVGHVFFINHISKCSGPPPPPILFDQSLTEIHSTKLEKRQFFLTTFFDVSLLSLIAVVDAEAPYQRRGLGLTSTPTICTCITLVRTFLCRFCTTTTSKCLILRFMDNVNKQRPKRQNFFLFSWKWSLHLTKCSLPSRRWIF